MSSSFPLTPGQRGEAIRDLQRRLGAAGCQPAGAEPGVYCPNTEHAVRAFQTARGLRPDGICDEHTWLALVEASWSLGDRALYLTSPNLRGDDVAELQTRLARLGFDSGRVDGIFGPRTARAVDDFQVNCGLRPDGVCGTETVRAILRVSGQTGDGPGIAAVREREALRSGPASLADCRIVVGQFGGLSSLVRPLARDLRLHGASVMTLDEPDAVAQALAANQFAANVYLGFEASDERSTVVHFYRVPTFESHGGRTLAEGLVAQFAVVPQLRAATVGMRLPVLRETRMPAVLITVGPLRQALDAAPLVVDAALHALELWISRAG
ncbi:MAG: peptidoglycan-binding protein [Ilumatobacteraceae bacterium]